MMIDMNSLSGLLTPEQKADLGTVMKDLQEYVEWTRNTKFPCLLTEAAGTHAPGHVSCAACVKERDMLNAIVGGQGMAKLPSKARQEVINISLKCDKCRYETKVCRNSRAKKHMTSHWEKHHSGVMDIYRVELGSQEVCQDGREGREAYHDEEKNLHLEKEIDSISTGEGGGHEAHHAGGEDGSAAQHVLEERYVDSDGRDTEQSLQVDDQHGGGTCHPQGKVNAQVVLFEGDNRGEEVQVDDQLCTGEDYHDTVLDDQPGESAGDVDQDPVCPQVVSLREIAGGEEEQLETLKLVFSQ